MLLRLSALDVDNDKNDYHGVPVASSICALEAGLMVTGTIEGHRTDLLIGGIIDGTVTARSVFITTTGKVSGHLRAEKIEIAGCFNGRIEAMQVNLLDGSLTDATIYHNALTIEPGASVRGLQPWRPVGYIKDLRQNW